MTRYCEIALPVPLRTTFTYAVPESVNGDDLVGRRLVVPFRNRTMIGVGLAVSPESPKAGHVKQIAQVLDAVPALPAKLLELGQWISRYYVAPIGEALRAMLPPEVELRREREYLITAAGISYVRVLGPKRDKTRTEGPDMSVLRRFEDPNEPLAVRTVYREPSGEAT